jgi:hypothetical protein
MDSLNPGRGTIHPMKLRFSIRDLLWLTLVVAMAVGWWIDHASPRTTATTPFYQFEAENYYGEQIATVRDLSTGEVWVKTSRGWSMIDGGDQQTRAATPASPAIP